MTNHEILQIAMQQSAYDLNAEPQDFLSDENVIRLGGLGERAKRYYEAPISCGFVSYGNNIVASVTDECRELVEQYLKKYVFYHCFETPNLHILTENLQKVGQTVCFMAEYYLPDVNKLKELPCQYELRVLEKKDFEGLYLPEWDNALCEKRKELDMLGVGAYDHGKLIGFAACSADCDSMWQIGVDVLPEYRRQGIASTITGRLAIQILERDKVPFYCSAWSNIRSVRNAVKSGFIPAWVEMTAKPISVVEEMNR